MPTTGAPWGENPYGQDFGGGKFFEHRLPLDPSSMSRWRGRLKEAGVETMLAELIATGLRSGAIRPSMLERVNVDTTVQEKFIRFPTDARLYDRMRERLVTAAQRRGIALRQSDTRVGRHTLTSQQRDGELTELLQRAQRLLTQPRQDREKLYSVHAPEVECLAKGKVQKRYEFDCKVSGASTSRGNWMVGARRRGHGEDSRRTAPMAASGEEFAAVDESEGGD